MLKFKKIKYEIHGVPFYEDKKYNIYDGNKKIGTISYIKKYRKIIIEYLNIFDEYKKMGYGSKVVETLLSKNSIECIIGETLGTSRGFWHKMIKKYNGSRRNITYNDNTTSSFVIPKNKITNEEIYSLFEYCDSLF